QAPLLYHRSNHAVKSRSPPAAAPRPRTTRSGAREGRTGDAHVGSLTCGLQIALTVRVFRVRTAKGAQLSHYEVTIWSQGPVSRGVLDASRLVTHSDEAQRTQLNDTCVNIGFRN